MSNASEKIDILSLFPDELTDYITEAGFPRFRSEQIQIWLAKGIKDFMEMNNLPMNLREYLSEKFYIQYLKMLKKQVSATDGTLKFLWELRDGNSVETVFMRYKHGNSLCISTQVGCRMGCKFCASTIGGLVRNLKPSEILSEVMESEAAAGDKVSNIVLMGIGEPLDNFENVIRFLHLVNNPKGENIGLRHISLSTSGYVPMIDKLSELNLQLTLSVSLHAPNNEIRSKIMPVNKAYPIEELLDSCNRYYKKTGRRISFEYAMIKNVNDSESSAVELSKRIRDLHAHINLIRLNNVEESELKPSDESTIKKFVSVLEKNGINVTIRRKLGSDIDAACGQLRRKKILSQ